MSYRRDDGNAGVPVAKCCLRSFVPKYSRPSSMIAQKYERMVCAVYLDHVDSTVSDRRTFRTLSRPL
jgi:hypothetical protein